MRGPTPPVIDLTDTVRDRLKGLIRQRDHVY